MVGKTSLILLLVLAIGLVAGSVMAADYIVDLNIPGITQVDCGKTCGAASCQMVTKAISGNTCPNDQWAVYNYCHSHNMEVWSIDPQGEAYGLWNYTPNGWYFDDWRYDYGTTAIRGTCQPIDQYRCAVPVVIHSAAHWVVERGFVATRAVYGNYGYTGGTLVKGLYINDPLYPSCGGYVGGWNWYTTASNWATYHFNNVVNTSWWGGHRVSAERDILANLHAHMHNGDWFQYY